MSNTFKSVLYKALKIFSRVLLLVLIFMRELCFAQSPHLILPISAGDFSLIACNRHNDRVLTCSSINYMPYTGNKGMVWDVGTGKLLFELPNHSGKFINAMFSNDGRYIVTASYGTIKVWNAFDGSLIHDLSEKGESYFNICLDDESKHLIVCTGSGYSYYDLSTGTKLHKDPEGKYGFAITISHNGKYIIIGYSDRDLNVISSRTFKTLYTIPDASGARRLSVSDDDSKFVVCMLNGQVKEYSLDNGKLLAQVFQNDVLAWDSSYTPDGKYFFVSSDYTRAALFESGTGKLIFSISGQMTSSFATLSPDGKFILSSSTTGLMNIYEVPSGKLLKSVPRENPNDYLKLGMISADSRTIFTISGKNRFYGWNTSDFHRVIDFNFNNASHQLASVKPLNNTGDMVITTMDSAAFIWNVYAKRSMSYIPVQLESWSYYYSAVSPDGKLFAAVNLDSIALWSCPDRKFLFSLKKPHDAGIRLEFNQQGDRLICVGRESILLFDLTNRKQIKKFGRSTDNEHSACFSSDGNMLATCAKDTVNIWNARDGTLMDQIINPARSEVSLAVFNSQSDHLLILSDNATVYNIRSHKILFQIKLRQSATYAKYSPDGSCFVVHYFDKPVFEVRDGKTGALMFQNEAVESVTSTVFSPKGDKLAVSYIEGGLRLFDTRNGKILGSSHVHIGNTDVAFTPDGQFITSASWDNTFRVWDDSLKKLIYTMVPLNQTDYLVSDAAGRYDGTTAARKLLYYVCGDEIITLDQLRELAWEPGLTAKLTGADKQPLQARKLNEISVCGVTPLVQRIIVADDDYHYRITPRSGGLRQVLLWVNDQNIKSYEPEQLVKRLGYYELTIKPAEIKDRLYSDRHNTIDVRAYAASVKLISKGDPSDIGHNQNAGSRVSHRLYSIAVGIIQYKGDALNTLHFASQDATDMSLAVSQAAKKLLDTGQHIQSVFSYLLRTPPKGSVSPGELLPFRDNIRRVFREVAQKATPDDIVVVFLSGHGVLQSDQFYYLTADASSFDLTGAENSVAIGTDTLKKWLLDIRANKKILILDACNSGQTVASLNIRKDIPADQKRSLDNLNERTGTFILAASASGHSAFEMTEYGQGILAYNLLLGIKTGAGLRDDKFIDVSTWFKFASDKVDLMAKDNGERQQPQSWGEGSASGIDIGEADATIKNNIVLSNKKPVLGRCTVANTDLFSDDLQIENMIESKLTELSFQGKSSKLMFINNAQGADIYQINCLYKKQGSMVTGKLVLLQKNKAIATENINISDNQVKDYIGKLVDKITDLLDN